MGTPFACDLYYLARDHLKTYNIATSKIDLHDCRSSREMSSRLVLFVHYNRAQSNFGPQLLRMN